MVYFISQFFKVINLMTKIMTQITLFGNIFENMERIFVYVIPFVKNWGP